LEVFEVGLTLCCDSRRESCPDASSALSYFALLSLRLWQQQKWHTLPNGKKISPTIRSSPIMPGRGAGRRDNRSSPDVRMGRHKNYLETRHRSLRQTAEVFAVSVETAAADFTGYGENPEEPASRISAPAVLPRAGSHTLHLHHDNDLFFYDLAVQRFRRLTHTGKEQNPRFSPDGEWVAYTETAISLPMTWKTPWNTNTPWTAAPRFTNGWASWVYYERRFLERASQYAPSGGSPDSTGSPTCASMTARAVPHSIMPTASHGELETQRYPKGYPIPMCHGVVDVKVGKTVLDGFRPKAITTSPGLMDRRQ